MARGSAIAGAVAPPAAVHEGPGPCLQYVAVASGLIALAAHTARRSRSALRISLILLAPEFLGAFGANWELAHGIAPAKAASVPRLGVDPRFGVALNLAYSPDRVYRFL